jgi:methionyl-tRNA synthetase
MKSPFYVTTPIYYVNDKPHIGHAYTTIAADVLVRYHRLRGEPARLLTGTDEHGLKLERRAKEEGVDTQAFVDSMAPRFLETAKAIGAEIDDFIRTTEPRHKAGVQALWKKLEAAGDIYLGEYQGLYCVGCEAYYTEKDLLEGRVCPTHKKPVEEVTEKSYFFRLSRFTEPLLAHYEANPGFVAPEGRFNEVKSFVKEGLRDLSVSRTSFKWGVPVPGSPEHVMYVWLDALTNYISALGGPDENAPLFKEFWPPNGRAIHLVGKDILRFHAVYWPAFLLSAGIAPPTQVWAHGWLTVDGEKMSKSLGNFIAPEPIVNEVGADVLRYYLMRDVGFGQDGDFSHKNLFARYHGDLGNGLGNLLNRIVTGILPKSFDGTIPAAAPEQLTDLERDLIALAARSAKDAAEHLERVAPHRALEAMWELVTATNKYVDQTAPWALAKSGDTARLGAVCYTVIEALRWMSVMLWPFMPEKAALLRAQLGLAPLAPAVGTDVWPSAWGETPVGGKTAPATPLFPRFDPDQEKAILERIQPKAPAAASGVQAKAAPAATKSQSKPKGKPVEPNAPEGTVTPAATPAAATPAAATPAAAAPAAAPEFIEFEDFVKVKFKLGHILAAERVPKSDKLLQLQIDVGEAAPRQVLAGIGKHYEPEALIGKRVTVVANLKPRKMMGIESQGMVLAASSGELLSVLTVDKELPGGSDVK